MKQSSRNHGTGLLALGSSKKDRGGMKLPPDLAFFDNLPALLKLEAVAAMFGWSTKTLYDWRYRQRQNKVPQDLFVKFNGQLFIRTEKLRDWFVTQNLSLL